ncbi:MmyB family transcriptional regulator [Kribbella kalugense]|uniref:Helix-turn-helix protein n=1 Tax=Kribbella kalugense TaxID=2512221 RepID=A0A4R8A268_9ACTN|nr:helix-turn-helix domain-containing protein [Kribbella kalugense]TDW24306.1 helix-turn-helix protein [Kribbella kalugense]
MDVSRRNELGDFLRKCRARRTPMDAGLPTGPRRKTPGLRREEVAELAGVGPTWYTWLEQGRPINVSLRTLNAIADALGLTRPEREHMFRLAGVTSSHLPGSDNRTDAEIPEVVRALITKIEPYPGCVYDPSYNVLLCNEAYAACFPELSSANSPDRNILRYLSQLNSTQSAAQENLIRAMIGRFRSNYSANIDNPSWHRLIEDVIVKNTQMKRYWEEQIVNDAADSVDSVSTAVGEITFTSASFATGTSPALNVLVGVPRTNRDRALLEELLRATPGPTALP